jgi:catechol 2,3-dioxygenase-like lactoylglutathione lyase family enzyme
MRGRIDDTEAKPRELRHDYWGVVLDAPSGPELAHFYADLLGWEIASEGADGAAIAPREGVAYISFQTSAGYVPPVWPNVEGAQQMMLHLDFEVSDLAASVEHARQLGARQADFQPQDNVRVMLDPAGHPFCLYTDA